MNFFKKRKHSFPLGALLLLVVLGGLVPTFANETSLLLPTKKPSELLLPALESALNQPHTASSSFLKSNSFQVRDNIKPTRNVRRLKSAASESKTDAKPCPPRAVTDFPKINPPLSGVKIPDRTSPVEVLQYDPNGLFALKLVPVSPSVEQKGTSTAPQIPTAVRNIPSNVSVPSVVSVPSNVSIPSNSKGSAVEKRETDGARLAAIGSGVTKLPAVAPKSHETSQSKDTASRNSLLVMPAQPPTLPTAQAPATGIVKTESVSKRAAPVPANQKEAFDLGSAAMGYMNGNSRMENGSVNKLAKPLPPVAHQSKPWFSKLPQDDFLIGFDSESEIGRAESKNPNLAASADAHRYSPGTPRHVSLPTVPMALGSKTDTTNPAKVEVVASHSSQESESNRNAHSTSQKPSSKSARKPSEKSDFVSWVSFGKIKPLVKSTHVKHASPASPARPAAPQDKVKKGTAKKGTGSADVAKFFADLNPFARKKK